MRRRAARTRARARVVLAARAGAGLLVLAVAATLVTSFTATTNVPASNVGASYEALTIPELAPPGCSTLALTSVHVGSGEFSNAGSHVLVLGGAGTDVITDTGVGNCIVAGGGTNSVIGTSSDVCVTGATLDAAGPCPTSDTTTTTVVSNPNGVTATASSDNYGDYGGQERLAFTNSAVVTAFSITIRVRKTKGVTFNSQANSYPGGALTQRWTVSGGVIVYSFVLGAREQIPAGYASGVVYAQYGGTGSAHSTSGDTWTVTSTSMGTVSTLSGTF